MDEADVNSIRRLVAANRLREAGRLFAGRADTRSEISDELIAWQAALANLDRLQRQDEMATDASDRERRKLARRLLELLREYQERHIGEPVFLSYNHHDASAAEQLRQDLESNSIRVVMDHVSMAPGQPIGEFIGRSIASTRATILIISREALISGWVGSETTLARAASQLSPDRKVIVCYLDDAFLSPDIRVMLTQAIDEKLDRLRLVAEQGAQLNIDSRELAEEQYRLRDLRHALGNILALLRGTLCLDIRTPQREASFRKLAQELAPVAR